MIVQGHETAVKENKAVGMSHDEMAARTPLLDANDDDDDTSRSSIETKRRLKNASRCFPGTMWTHCLCGIPVGFAAAVTVRALALLLLCKMPLPTTTTFGHWSAATLMSLLGFLVLMTNGYYLYVIIATAADEHEEQYSSNDSTSSGRHKATRTTTEATIGIMIGFCSSWVFLSLVLYKTIAGLPLLLTVMYVVAYCQVQQAIHQRGQGRAASSSTRATTAALSRRRKMTKCVRHDDDNDDDSNEISSFIL